MFVYSWDRDRTWTGEGQGERETQNLKQAPGSELSAQSLTRGSNSRTVRSWPEPKSDTQPTEPPRRPKRENLKQTPRPTWSRTQGSLPTVRSWPEPKSRVGPLTDWAPSRQFLKPQFMHHIFYNAQPFSLIANLYFMTRGFFSQFCSALWDLGMLNSWIDILWFSPL